MSLKTVYERFLASPKALILSEDASLNYISTIKTFTKPETIIQHLENQNKTEVRKDAERILAAVEGQSSLSVDVETSLKFISGGGAYLPGLENFVTDKTATFPSVHIVNFDSDGKIQRIRIYWDQASLLRQVDVIGSRGKNWPIVDGRDQSRLVASVLAGSKIDTPIIRGRDAADGQSEARSLSPSKKRIQDPHASLDLFSEQEKEASFRQPQPAMVAPRASAKPAQREYSELFAAGHEDLEPSQNGEASPKKSSAQPAVAPKGAGSAKFQPSRLFDENAAEDRPAGYKSNPTKYNHFELAEGMEDDHFQPKTAAAAKNVPMRAKSNKHMSQWNFEDFTTPDKIRPRVRGQDVRHFGWSDDEGENVETPGRKPRVVQPRPDSRPHFEFQDDRSPDADRPVRTGTARGTGQNSSLGLYQNNLYNDEDDVTSTRSAHEKEPLSALPTNVGRSKDMDRHWVMSDLSPTDNGKVNNENRPLAGDRKKAVQMMDANWSSYDHSPQQSNKSVASKPLPKGMESHWNIGDQDSAPKRDGRQGDKSFWDF